TTVADEICSKRNSLGRIEPAAHSSARDDRRPRYAANGIRYTLCRGNSPRGKRFSCGAAHRVLGAKFLDLAPGRSTGAGYVDKLHACFDQPARIVTGYTPADFLDANRTFKQPAQLL